VSSFIIGVSGGSGSGKTSFIQNLKDHFQANEVCFVSQDDYYKPKEFQVADQAGIANFDLPQAVFRDDLVRDLSLLRSGKYVQREEYTFNNKLANPKYLHFEPAPVLIVEGLFIYHFEEIRQMLNLSLFIQAKENLKVIRRIRRDQTERNYPVDDVLYRYENHVMPAYEKYVLPYVDEVDIVINNNRHFNQALRVVRGFISDYLKNR